MGKIRKKLRKPNPYLNTSSTQLVRTSTTRSTLVPSTPTSPTFPSTNYPSPTESHASLPAAPMASISRAITPQPTPASALSPLSQPEINRLSDIIDPLEVMDLCFPPIPITPANTVTNTPNTSPPLVPYTGIEEPVPPIPARHPRHIALGNRTIVNSPSGNAFGIHEFINYAERPLAMWERQERIMSATQEKVQALEEKRSMSRLTLRAPRSRVNLREAEKKVEPLSVEPLPLRKKISRQCWSMFGL